MINTRRILGKARRPSRAARHPSSSKSKHWTSPTTAGSDAPKAGWSLAEERATYATAKDELVASHEGQYVLIKGSEVVGIYPTMDEVEGAAIDTFGDEPRLIRRIQRDDAPAILNILGR